MQHKVLFISGWYPSPRNKTHGIFVKRYAEAVALQNEVAVIHPVGDESFPDEVKIEGKTVNNVFEVYVFYKKKSLNPLSRFTNYKKNYFLGLEYLLKNWGRPDLLQVNVFFPTAVAGLEIAKKLDIPFVVSEHWTGYNPLDGSYNGVIKKFFTRLAAKKSSAIITVTRDLQHSMEAHHINGNYYVIPNVVDTSVFNYAPLENTGRFRFLHVSSLDNNQKNVAGLIEVFKRLNKDDNCELFIIGEGPGKKELQKKAGLALNRSVFFLGQRFGADLALEFNSADCFVMFSNYENLPVVILEAICCGLPLISTNVGGIAEWIEKEQGLLIKAHDHEGLLNAMTEMKVNTKKYDRKKISEKACENFNYHKIASAFTDVYNEVLKRQL